MKLPKNPTPEQVKQVMNLVIKSIYTRGTVAVQTIERDSRGRLSGIFLGDGVRFNYTVADGALSYAPVNPSDLPDEDGADFMEDALDFARLKLAGNTKQVKACKKGYACGYTCISQNRNCRKPLPGQARTAAEWVAQQKGLDKPTLHKGTPIQVLEMENRLRPQKFESLVIFDKDGNQILFKDGEQYEVAVTNGELAKMKDQVVTHNHPRGWEFDASNPRSKGSSFSPEDLDLAATADVAEIRAVSRGYRFSMKRPTQGWPDRLTMRAIIQEERDQVVQLGYARINKAWSADERDRIIQEEEAKLWDLVSTRVAKRIGANYEREDFQETPWI
jgi:hypothetical protein